MNINKQDDTETKRNNTWVRDNLILQVELVLNDIQRFNRLKELLLYGGGEPTPTIVYVSTKYETGVLKSRLDDDLIVGIYHSGLILAELTKTQSDFLANKLQVIICTVAFGMGVNKLDVRRVIHYNCPSSVEEYTQEIGRDGLQATCVCLFNREEATRFVSLSKSNGMDSSQLRVF